MPKKNEVVFYFPNEKDKKFVTDDDITILEKKEIINDKYKKSNEFTNLVKQATDGLMGKYKETKQPLLDLTRLIDTRLKIVNKNNTWKFEYDLTKEELHFMAIKIPSLCVSIQEFVSDKVLDADLAELLADYKKTENLDYIEGSSGVERVMYAKLYAQYEEIVSIVKVNIVKDLKSLIERADRLYEGIKKVIDSDNNGDKQNNRYAGIA